MSRTDKAAQMPEPHTLRPLTMLASTPVGADAPTCADGVCGWGPAGSAH